MRTAALLVLNAILAACTPLADVGPSKPVPLSEWAEIAVDDLHFIRATLRENHPGPKDAENPWFRTWHEQGFHEAIRLARSAEDKAGYYFAIKRYVVGFQDGHLGALGEPGDLNPALGRSWPDFTVGYRDGAFVVAEASPDSGVEPGDRLVECDGRSATELGETILEHFVGLWSVEGARPRYAPFLFVDEGNPFVKRPKSCAFLRAGEEQRIDLSWQAIGFDSMKAKLASTRQAVRPQIGIREFGVGGRWISLSSFDLGDDDTAAALREVTDALAAEPDELRGASVLVFDVRGNTGGSSTVGSAVAGAVWGEDYIQWVRPRPKGVDWRLSSNNARFLRRTNLARYEKRYGADDKRTINYANFVDNFDRALASGDEFLTETWNPGRSKKVPPMMVSARVFFLTDAYCASACLGFADIMTRIEGVTHVGRETSADAIYIDNTGLRLPSGEGWLGYSMKVYRGRPRGHNESYVPRHAWSGDMADDDALEAWVLDLAKLGGHRAAEDERRSQQP